MLVHDVINLLYYECWTDKQKCFYVYQTKSPDVFESNSLAFWVNSATIEAQFISHNLFLSDLEDEYPLACDAVSNSTYVDGSMISWSHCDIQLYLELSILWGKASMHARKWRSSLAKVLEKVSEKYLQMKSIYENNIYHEWKHLDYFGWQAKINSHTTVCQLKHNFNIQSGIP